MRADPSLRSGISRLKNAIHAEASLGLGADQEQRLQKERPHRSRVAWRPSRQSRDERRFAGVDRHRCSKYNGRAKAEPREREI